MKRYFKAFGYLLSVHVLALLVMTLFRLVEFIALHGMIVDAEASRVMAFVKGVWFDNVIACYISVLPVAVLLIAASLGWCHRHLLRGINIWYAAWFAIAFMPSMNRSFCYDVLPNGNLKETKLESKFQDLKNYVFSNIQAAEYIERHQQ